MKRFVCIHGHFYQPPRENPWLEEIELQDSAYPYRDWNERITAECYEPNTASRIFDSKSNIIDIINNYARMSFNFGPTLLMWLERIQPEVYNGILEADKLSRDHFSGHGAALAQAYNHMIMPLANERDKQTQVAWGIRDFESRFKRKPEGMWLPETAVDLATLEVLAGNGIVFTLLAPHQARNVRKIGEQDWKKVQEVGLDPHCPYLCSLPSGKKIVLFFYDGPISHDIAFGDLLKNGEGFAKRITAAFPHEHEDARLIHLASDGETYGHHHRFGNMALSYCLHYIESHNLAKITIPGEFLAHHPPEDEVEIVENSSWSCAHGVERWRADCGCHIGSHADWRQSWRGPLRKAMDWLRDEVTPVFEKEMSAFCQDPWGVRNEYIHVILDRSRESIENFFEQHMHKPLSEQDKIKILKLLEMQRHAMYMYTSCGWFFDDISGIEAVQILQYAARVLQLEQEISGVDMEKDFIKKLKSAPSNIRSFKNGAEIYKKEVKPTVTDLLHVGAHFAVSSVFEKYPASTQIYSYTVDTKDYFPYEKKEKRLILGIAVIRSLITGEERCVEFSVCHLRDYNLYGGVRYYDNNESFTHIHEQLKGIFFEENISKVLQKMKDIFGRHNYSLWDLFKNEQGKVLNQIFAKSLLSIEKNFREVYDHYYPLMKIKPNFRFPLPKAMAMTAEFILMRDMIKALEADEVDVRLLEKLSMEIVRWSFTRDKETLSYVASKKINTLMGTFSKEREAVLLKTIWEVLRILKKLSLNLDLWKTQNIYFSMAKNTYPEKREQAEQGDPAARQWVTSFDKLGHYLKVKRR